jgi:hypothetical protein
MIKRLIRTLRTQSSERFILQAVEGEDSAVVELHYLPSGNVAGTLIIFEGAGLANVEIHELLQKIDEMLLPEISVEHHKVSFTAVRGQVVGDFTPNAS